MTENRHSTESTTEYTAALTPTPRAIESTAKRVNRGAAASLLSATHIGGKPLHRTREDGPECTFGAFTATPLGGMILDAITVPLDLPACSGAYQMHLTRNSVQPLQSKR